MSNLFSDYCIHENIKCITITTELLRANCQIECLNAAMISVLSSCPLTICQSAILMLMLYNKSSISASIAVPTHSHLNLYLVLK